MKAMDPFELEVYRKIQKLARQEKVRQGFCEFYGESFKRRREVGDVYRRI